MDISKFSDEQIAGQRLMAGFDGTEFNEDLEFLIGTLKIGGIILFSRNLIEPEQIKKLCSSVQEYAKSIDQPPLFVSIDQEGGVVARLKPPFTQFPGGAPAMKTEEDAEYFAEITASELKEVGVNMNMAPVLDVLPRGFDGIMVKRVFGHDPVEVSELGLSVISTLQKNNIMAVGKHFPGIGRTTLDSHLDMPYLDIDVSKMETTDLLPFRSAIKNDVAGIMLSHIFYTRLDKKCPASLSSVIAKDLLRKQMGYDGVVMTDDLDMGAIKKHYDIEQVIRQILSADIDIALICHKGPDQKTAFEEILNGIRDINVTSGVESFERIMRLKERYLEE